MSKVQKKCLVEGCNDFGQYKGYQGTSATKYYSNYCYGHDRASDRPALVEADKELDEILKDFLDATDFVLEYPEKAGDDKDFFDRPYTEAKQALYQRLAAEAEKIHAYGLDGPYFVNAIPIDKLKAIMEIKES